MKKINNNIEYEAILKRVNELAEVVTDENWGNAESIEFDFLCSLIEDYEKEHYPMRTPSLKEVLELRMQEMDLNQAQLARLLEVSPARISDYLNGAEPSRKVCRIMYDKLKISAKVLLGVNQYPEIKA
ncbi:MAG: helix-turn-helix domain-containing protein [Candidatus Azobacteroides sp.]|nr:helix-turn-helix domain-containing protein [Candidatus Azobacteroides sp.]